MAISLVSSPVTWARVWDTNRMTYTFSSDNISKPNFQFQFVLRVWNSDGTYIDLGSYNVYPLSGGTVQFNPSTIYRNYISYNYNASINYLTEALDGAKKFSLSVYEYYGTPPVRSSVGGEAWTGELGGGTPLNVYNGTQANIPYDYTTLNTSGNTQWVMTVSGTGQYLTDATEYRLDNDDIAFLWFNAQSPARPTRIKYTYYYTCYGSGIAIIDGALGSPGFQSGEWQTQTMPQRTPFYDLNDPGIPDTTPPGYYSWTGTCSGISYDTTISYTTNNSLQHYFPMGPAQLIAIGQFLTGITNTWLYYDIDLLCGTTLMNRNPFRVYKTCKSDKYGKWQLSWLNRHGGFDTYTFDRKSEIKYSIEKSTYKQRLPVNPSYSTYDASERVYNIQTKQEITLRSNLLTQREAQLLIGLVQSPRVYVNTIYYRDKNYSYAVPYIVTTTEIIYPNKKNDKEIVMEIKIRPANDAIIQND